ncbi:MAG: LamG-like jellyroll fold domain-containing protein [Bacteroidota bacterium]
MKPMSVFLVAISVFGVFVNAQTTEDDFWDHRFGTQGTNGTIRAVLSNGNKMYIGGEFTTAGGVTVNRIAMWDSTGWTALGSGINGTVYALAMIGNDLYAAGNFTNAGGVSANSIAKWNGSSWSALGSGLTAGFGGGNTVYALAAVGSTLYAAGDFSAAGGNVVVGIAQWNGSSWSDVDGSFDGAGYALATDGTNLYAGGTFTAAGGVSANRVAKWDGSSWTALGDGVNFFVAALTMNGSDLYVGGWFTSAGGVGVNNIAKWNGSSWSAVGTGTATVVYSLAYNNGVLYAGGTFQYLGDGFTTTNYIAQFNGSSWSPVSSGMNGAVYALGVYKSDLVAGGAFTGSSGVTTNYLARWTGSNWYSYGGGPNSTVRAAALLNGVLYVGGNFTNAGGISANYIAKWDGLSWSPVGSGMNADVWALIAIGSDVYAGGEFTTAGGNSAERIAKWNGSSWSALGSGIGNSNQIVEVLAVDSNGDLYAGGNFSTAGGNSASNIARWDGANWSALGSGTGNTVTSLAIMGSDLYVGGTFTSAGGNSANRIAKWNGSTWSALGTGLNWNVSAIAVSGTDLYVGGSFTTAGDSSANYIAKWDGTMWSPLSSGMSIDLGTPEVLTLISHSGYIYAGGSFTSAGGVSAYDIAKWDGSNWSSLGSSLNGITRAFASDGSNLYIGGDFNTIFTPPYIPTVRVARWFLPAPSQPAAYTFASSNITFTSAVLNGAVDANGDSATVRFLYGTSSGVYTDSVLAIQSPVPSLDSLAVSATLSGLTPSQTYYVRVSATNSFGYVLGSEVSFTANALPILSTVPGTLLTFNGSTQYVSVPDNASLQLTDSLTIEAWVYPTRNSNVTILDKGNYNYLFEIFPNGQTALGLYNASWGWIYSSGTVPTNQWSHVAVVFQTGTNGVKFYLNGTLLSEHTAPGSLTTNSGAFAIGMQAPGSCNCNFFEGKIDEVKIWNVTRTVQQIRESMHRTLNGTESGLVSYWQLNEGSGSVAADSMGSNHGTLVNSPAWTTSTIPAGGGSSGSTSSFISGTTSLGTVVLSTTDAFDASVDITATQINSAPDSLPTASSTVLNDRYWIINAFGSPGTFSTSLAFVVPSTFTNSGTAGASSYKLYKRSSTSDGTWDLVVNGAARIAADTVVFDNVTSFSQFTIGTDDPLPVELVSLSISSQHLNAELKWKTASEVNNAGWEVQRSEIRSEMSVEVSHSERSEESSTWAKVRFVEGNGTTNAPKEYSFIDRVQKAGKYLYRLKQIDRDGKFSYSQEVEVTVGSVPKVFALEQNYPNPFNPTTTIGFTLQVSGLTTLKIYDAIGREVATLVNENLEAGVYHQKTFDAGNLSSGIYFARLQANGKQMMKKMLVMK